MNIYIKANRKLDGVRRELDFLYDQFTLASCNNKIMKAVEDAILAVDNLGTVVYVNKEEIENIKKG